MCSSMVPRRDQVGQQHVVLLADPVQTAEPLLDLHRVPRQVDVDHDVAELQVAALAGRLGGQQHRRVAGEGGDRGVLLPARTGCRGRRRPRSRRGDSSATERVQGVPERGEHQHLLAAPRRAGAAGHEQLVELARPPYRRGPPGQIGPADLVAASAPPQPGWTRPSRVRRAAPAAVPPSGVAAPRSRIRAASRRSSCCSSAHGVTSDGLGQPVGQQHRDLAAPVAHHHLRARSRKLRRRCAARRPSVSAGAVGAAELRGRAQQARRRRG